ncbi:basic salivary proline-rich protein 1-like [Gouania willdenowi]|uniref:basic salivary proline-rich protein 1-like n=1 Tax=Gouania willdenowi TaxID=441366 RepID=UPI0010548E35|nr:basic salivary proline-rich protein 1-like [Gouania willdenowi]
MERVNCFMVRVRCDVIVVLIVLSVQPVQTPEGKTQRAPTQDHSRGAKAHAQQPTRAVPNGQPLGPEPAGIGPQPGGTGTEATPATAHPRTTATSTTNRGTKGTLQVTPPATRPPEHPRSPFIDAASTMSLGYRQSQAPARPSYQYAARTAPRRQSKDSRTTAQAPPPTGQHKPHSDAPQGLERAAVRAASHDHSGRWSSPFKAVCSHASRNSRGQEAPGHPLRPSSPPRCPQDSKPKGSHHPPHTHPRKPQEAEDPAQPVTDQPPTPRPLTNLYPPTPTNTLQPTHQGEGLESPPPETKAEETRPTPSRQPKSRQTGSQRLPADRPRASGDAASRPAGPQAHQLSPPELPRSIVIDAAINNNCVCVGL